ncbi:MAG TPA: SDR family oxidoreductase [Cyclobacteriaceae bacterium]
MESPFSLINKTVLVTGASSGIGKKIALTVALQGARVVLLGRNTARLEEVMQELPGEGHVYHAVDITDETKLNEVVQVLPVVHGLVHAAGILELAPLKILNAAQMNKITLTNYVAPVQFTRHLINKKVVGNGSSVVFITSVNGVFTAVKGFTAYAGAKAALSSASKIFALEYASRQIRFNTIAPGMIKTEMYEQLVKTVSEESIQQDKQKYPLGDYGNTEDVANAAVYLLSDASKWVTGTSLVVDGGLTIV